MPKDVTPARRRREDDESDEDEFDVSVDGGRSVRSNGSKRTRLDEGSDDESPEGQLLPDSFLRSPPSHGRAVDGLQNGHPAEIGSEKHKPGSIVRVTLTNFVTYTKAEFKPGPNLNMIIGPNGTGKSTLVCAICLGLGWSTSHLGRAKDLGEFVKHGAKRAEIEIELAADPARHEENPVITTKITKEGNKCEFLLNSKKSNKKGVMELARSFSIQVDNLCQFLPQDRVVEFAALSPVDLLTHTQRAAAPEQMSTWHEELKLKRNDQKQKQAEQQRDLEHLKNLEVRQRGQEGDVERLRERSGLQERVAALAKMRPFPKYHEARAAHTVAKNRKKEAQRELKLLERRADPNLRAVREKEHYLERIGKAARSRSNVLEKYEGTVNDQKKKLDENETRIQDIVQEFQAERDKVKHKKQSIPGFRQEIARFERAIQSPPEPCDFAAMNEQVREKQRRRRELDTRLEEIKHEVGSAGEQIKERETTVQRANREKGDLRSQAGQQASKLKQVSPDAAKVWQWIQDNRNKFSSEVFGPPIVECTVKNPSLAGAVETMIPDGDKSAFTVTSQDDMKMLLDKVSAMKLHNVNIRVSLQPLSYFNPPMETEALRRLHLEGWLLNLIEGPDAVLAMLCDNRNIHQIGYTTRDITEAQYNILKDSVVSSWVTSTQSFAIMRRRELGDKATSTRVQPVKQPRFFTDTPIDHQMERQIDARINEANAEMEELKGQIIASKEEGASLTAERKQVLEETRQIEEEKKQKQSAQTAFDGLPVKKAAFERKLKDAEEQVVSSRERQREILDRADKLHLGKGQLALNYANAIEALRGLHIDLLEAEIVQIEATSDVERLKLQHKDEQRQLDERKKEVKELQEASTELFEEGIRQSELCQVLSSEFTPEEEEVHQEVHSWSSEQLETQIESVKARLEMHQNGPKEGILQEFEKRARHIEVKRARLSEIRGDLEHLEADITEVREKWEPRLDVLVSKISEAFAENFARIQCAGEVTVHKDEDFEQWAIQIKVKFREVEQLSVLDSHRQSGGERAVSTIFYLMALQSLARAPFRVVDEINQGMDPRNERLVHSRMVDIACAEHTSQYFLITPKLLNGLKYHPNMKVHCIASGEYMPADHMALDFAKLAEKALARRGRASGVTSAA